MGLKKAIVQFTKPNGEFVTREFNVYNVTFRFRGDVLEVETLYEVFPSAAAKARGAAPEYVPQTIRIPLSDVTAAQMLLSVSEELWARNADEAFIEDWSDLDANDRQILNLRSFADLDAQIVDV